MQQVDGNLIFSASDLTGFLACDHLTQLEIKAAEGVLKRPHRDDPLVDLLSKKGLEHESEYKTSLEEDGLTIVSIPSLSDGSFYALQDLADQTEHAMRQGADVIYQAALFDGHWRGHADFLRRVDRPSNLGDFSYEVLDTKLARRPKAAALLQLCSYSDLVAQIQGLDPEECHLVLGTKEIQHFRLRDYVSYYRMIRNEFERVIKSRPETYPDPVEHCSICRWRSDCNRRRRGDDHLSLVAGMRRDQIKKLNASEIPTVEVLATYNPTQKVKGISPPSLAKLQDQAAMQVEKRSSLKIAYKILDLPGAGFGLEALPTPSQADIYFDIEADPYAEQEGLEFMFGWVDASGGEPEYHVRWAHDRNEERVMFEEFTDMISERFQSRPDMHVYHYAPYEVGALRRLMGRHGTREDELDTLLRAGIFVDCYQVVRQGVRISEESYSIKSLEPFYMDERDDPITKDSSALVEYERYLDSGDEAVLQALEDYNRYDCLSLYYLQRWLEERRTEAEEIFGRSLERPSVSAGDATEELSRAQQEVQACVDILLKDVPEDPIERNKEQNARWLLAQLLNWHRREAKSQWWAYFDRQDKTLEDLLDDNDSLSGLAYEGVVDEVGRSEIHKFTFPVQEHKIKPGGYEDPETRKSVNVVGLNDDARYVLIRKGKGRKDFPRAIVPGQPYDTKVQRRALLRIAQRVGSGTLEPTGADKAIREVVLGMDPDVSGWPRGSDLRGVDEETLDAACRIGLALNNSCLPIQGPPGAGKTYTGAHMIVELVRAGKTVGVTANSHKVISNLLQEACDTADKLGVKLNALQRCPEEEVCSHGRVELADDNDKFDDAFAAGKFQVVAGTSWLMCRPELEGALHTLFIDEAGQFSLADATAVSTAADNLVLLGDPRQLSQPSQGIHPEGAEVSILEHVLQDHETMPGNRGLFLEKTYRMHPAVCGYISEAFYEERLTSVDFLEEQDIDPAGPLQGPGIYLFAVEHSGNRISSPEEAVLILEVFDALQTVEWVNEEGVRKAVTLDDLLVVAPYNSQVGLLQRTLPKGARVGTVDKFQGQEGAVTFYSMATSHPEDIPRNFEFLYSHNRLNVAISRARAASVVLCSPELLKARCNTPEQMKLINALCLLAERANLMSPEFATPIRR